MVLGCTEGPRRSVRRVGSGPTTVTARIESQCSPAASPPLLSLSLGTERLNTLRRNRDIEGWDYINISTMWLPSFPPSLLSSSPDLPLSSSPRPAVRCQKQ